VLLVVLAVRRRDLLRVRREDVPALAFVGVGGLALVQGAYFIAIDRLQIGAALTIEYLAPLAILLWLRFFHGRQLRPALWGAVALSVLGCFFVVGAYHASSLDGLGVAAAFGSTITFAIYMVGSEREGRRYQPATILLWAFGFATLFWAVVLPPWSFPLGRVSSPSHALLSAAVITVGTLLPFTCIVAALRLIPASRAAVVATLEPALAALFAWVLHGESLAPLQIAGGAVVLAAVIWVQARGPDLAAEAAPPGRRPVPGGPAPH
jgi:drug/metabolite transporter (DMT)-like permease